ncbi:MAG: hypothetical protein IOB84_07875 [Brevundimonas sp.]|nr:hypothetical protein [Brevundimonas sp.]
MRRKARHLFRTGAGFGEFAGKTFSLQFQALDGVGGVEHGFDDVIAKGADQAEPVTGAGPCPGQDVFSRARVASDLSGEPLGRQPALAQKGAQTLGQKLRVLPHALFRRAGH